MFVCGLLRVSTNDQALGLDAQRASVEALAAREGLQVNEWVVEDGISGMLPLKDRQGLQKAIELFRQNGAGLLLVAEGSRISRNPLTHLLVENQLQVLGVRILSAKGEGYGSTSATDIFSSRVLMAQRELEANLTRERTRAALAALRDKKQGRYYLGRARYGFEVVDGCLQPKEEEWLEVVSWFQKKNAGWTQRAIAALAGKKQPFINRTLRRYRSIEGFLAFTEKEAPGSTTLLEASLSAL